MNKFYLTLSLCLGLFISQAQWTPQATGILPTGYSITSICVVNANTAWVVANDLAKYQAHNAAGNLIKVLVTSNGGSSWITHNVVSDFLGVDVAALDANNAYVTVNDFGVNQSLFKTTDGGTSWIQVSPSPGAGTGSIVRYFNPSDVMLFNNGAIKISNNGGSTWQGPAVGPSFLGNESVVFDNAHNGLQALGNRAWFGTNNHRIFRSMDKGNTWNVATVQSMPVNSVIQTIAFVDSMHGLAVASLLFPNYNYDVASHAAKSSNGGGLWMAAPNLPAVISNLCAVPGSSNAYVGVAGGTGTSPVTMITVDGGSNWFVVNTTTALGCVAFVSPTTGWASNPDASNGSSPAIYKWSGSPVNVNEIESTDEINLYPSPATDFINITMSEQQNWENATLMIYDQTGRLCYESNNLIAGKNIDIHKFEKGVYFVKVTNGKQFATLKFSHL